VLSRLARAKMLVSGLRERLVFVRGLPVSSRQALQLALTAVRNKLTLEIGGGGTTVNHTQRTTHQLEFER
jgi:hypothetical protein